MNRSSETTGAPTPALTTAVKKLLRPLVGLLLDHGLTYAWLTRVLKYIYVDIAESEFNLPGKELTDSRISILTGLHRKDIKRIRSEEKTNFDPPESIFIGAQLVAAWTTDARFVNSKGKPLALKRLESSDETSEGNFEELFRSVTRDIRPRAFLDEWLRLGVVSLDDEDRVSLRVEAFVPAKGFDEKAFFLGRNIHDHLATARSNVQADMPPFLERSVYYDQLSEESIEKLRDMVTERGMDTLLAINKEALKLQQKDKRNRKKKGRMSFGVYFFKSDLDD